MHRTHCKVGQSNSIIQFQRMSEIQDTKWFVQSHADNELIRGNDGREDSLLSTSQGFFGWGNCPSLKDFLVNFGGSEEIIGKSGTLSRNIATSTPLNIAFFLFP